MGKRRLHQRMVQPAIATLAHNDLQSACHDSGDHRAIAVLAIYAYNGAGLVAGSVALVGFGADSVVEALAGFIVIWRFTGARQFSETAERRALQLIASSFFLIAAYVGVEAIRNLVGREVPATSWVGLGLALGDQE
jgi:divalent metal cation (Fe/Co/Zn/Cd) transporter